MGVIKNFLLTDEIGGLTQDEDGQGMVEYALIIALLAIGVFAALSLTGDNVFKIYTEKIVSKFLEAVKSVLG